MSDEPQTRLETEKAREIAEQCLAHNLRRADRAVMVHYDAALRPFGLRMTQLALLVALRLSEPVTIRALARRMVMDRTTLTRNLAALERQGLVSITRGSDRRTREVTLTGPGHAVLARAYPEWREVQARARQFFGTNRVRGLVAALSGLVRRLGHP